MEKPSPRPLKEELQRERAHAHYEDLVSARGRGDVAEQTRILDEVFIAEKTNPRLEVLRDPARLEIVAKKRTLLSELRSSGVFVLEKGSTEVYYPAEVIGPDKPSKAQSFCSLVTTASAVKNLCEVIESDGISLPEFETIMKRIFNG